MAGRWTARLLAGLLLLLCCGCTGRLSAEPEGQAQAQPPFDAEEFPAEWGTLFVQTGLLSEADRAALELQIRRDVEQADRTVGGAGSAVAVCLADAPTAEQYGMDAAVFCCTPGQIRSGEYRLRLLEERYALQDFGILTGLMLCAFPEEMPSAEELAEYYRSAEHLPVLSLMAAYLTEDFAGAETLRMARSTAAQLVRYLLENGGLERVRASAFSEEDRNDWLRSIGVSAEYQNPYGVAFFENAVYRSAYSYPLVICVGTHGYRFLPIRDFSAPEEVWRALDQYAEGMQALSCYLKDHAPDAFERLSAQWRQPMTVSFSAGGESMESRPGRLTVGRLTDWIHETIHFLLEREPGRDPVWTQEGMATYLSCFAGSPFAGDPYQALLTLDYSAIADSPSKTVGLLLTDYCRTHGGETDPAQLICFRGMGLLRTRAEQLGADDFRPVVTSCADRRNEQVGGNYQNADGNELSYFQAMLIMDLLAEQNGLDPVLKAFFEDERFPERFGMDYLQALQAAEARFA